jgi:hypothetical protein
VTPRAQTPDELPAPESVAELLALGDEAFVRCAYLAILGREPDAGGLAAYLEQVRAGEDKARLLSVMAQSDDGRQARPTLAGLAELVREHPAGPPPWPRRLLNGLMRRLLQQPMEPAQRGLRALDNRLWRIEQLLAEQARVQRRLGMEMAQLSISLDMLRGGSARGNMRSEAALPQEGGQQVPPAVEALLSEMKRLPPLDVDSAPTARGHAASD